MRMSSALVYDDVEQALVDAGSSVHPSEAHGCLCGALCARRDYGLGEWLEEFLPEPGRGGGMDSAKSPFKELFGDTSAVLSEFDMKFTPLLPDDEAPMADRVEALAAWCQGFLYGLGSAGTASGMPMSDETSEMLADVAEIARAGSVGSDEVEVEEQSFTEIVEFLRAGTQLIFEELDAWRHGQAISDTQH